MVKGVSRRVIVVKSPDEKLFEEAIFIVKEDLADGKSSDELLKQAQQVADSYIQKNFHRSKGNNNLAAPALIAVGASISAAVYGVISLLI